MLLEPQYAIEEGDIDSWSVNVPRFRVSDEEGGFGLREFEPTPPLDAHVVGLAEELPSDRGACCFYYSPCCVETTEFLCGFAYGGDFQGIGTTCEQVFEDELCFPCVDCCQGPVGDCYSVTAEYCVDDLGGRLGGNCATVFTEGGCCEVWDTTPCYTDLGVFIQCCAEGTTCVDGSCEGDCPCFTGFLGEHTYRYRTDTYSRSEACTGLDLTASTSTTTFYDGCSCISSSGTSNCSGDNCPTCGDEGPCSLSYSGCGDGWEGDCQSFAFDCFGLFIPGCIGGGGTGTGTVIVDDANTTNTITCTVCPGTIVRTVTLSDICE